jgi:hypothetical protein
VKPAQRPRPPLVLAQMHHFTCNSTNPHGFHVNAIHYFEVNLMLLAAVALV